MSNPDIDVSGDVRITHINGNLVRGGWEMHFASLGETDLMRPFQFVQLYWDGYFGASYLEQDLLGLQGHVMPLQFSFDKVGSLTTHIATTTDAILRKGWLQGIHFIDMGADDRNHYHQFDDHTGGGERMTMGRIVKHILGYYDDLGVPPATNPDWVAHTNLVYDATHNPHGWITLDYVTQEPFESPGNPNGSMRVDHYIVRETNNLWSTIQQIAKNEFFVAYFDKENNLRYERHPMFSTVLPDVVMDFDEDFSLGKPIVYVRYMDAPPDMAGSVRQVKLHAVQDDGSTIHSDYPSSATHVYGQVNEISHIRCNDQDTLDEWARIQYLYDNRDCTVQWRVPGVCGLLFEIGDRVSITYTGTSANGVHIDWTEKKFWIHDIDIRPNESFSGVTRFMLEAENLP